MRDFFCFHDEKKRAVEKHIPRHRDSKTKNRDIEIWRRKTPQSPENGDS